MLKRRDLLKSVGAATGLLLGGLSISAQAQPATRPDAEPKPEGWTHPKHWEDPYNCPECGQDCGEGCCIASTSPQHAGVTGYCDWTETIQCTCGEKWDVDTGT